MCKFFFSLQHLSFIDASQTEPISQQTGGLRILAVPGISDVSHAVLCH